MTTKQDLKEQLTAEPWLPGTVEYYLEAPFMNMDAVIKQLIISLKAIKRLENIKGCGELTTVEKRFFNKYKGYIK